MGSSCGDPGMLSQGNLREPSNVKRQVMVTFILEICASQS